VDTNQVVLLIGTVVVLGALMLLPQWQARRRRRKQMAEMQVGSEVMTVGGIIGKLTHLDREANRARVEIQIVTAAISQSPPPTQPTPREK
jgi:preprotein translocase YajC subunit